MQPSNTIAGEGTMCYLDKVTVFLWKVPATKLYLTNFIYKVIHMSSINCQVSHEDISVLW